LGVRCQIKNETAQLPTDE
jgi:hypothetical protein